MKVLIVDDNKNMTTIIKMMIEKENHQALAAEDGSKGYLAYLLFDPDLVLTDIQMPGINGFELMAEIRRHKPSIKTIYMTGSPDRFKSRLKEEQDKHRAEFIRKPFSRAELARMLSELPD